MICKHIIKLWVTISYRFTDYTYPNNCKVLQSEQNILPISSFACNIFLPFILMFLIQDKVGELDILNVAQFIGH